MNNHKWAWSLGLYIYVGTSILHLEYLEVKFHNFAHNKQQTRRWGGLRGFMDTSSIITQVNREDEPLSISPASEKSKWLLYFPRPKNTCPHKHGFEQEWGIQFPYCRLVLPVLSLTPYLVYTQVY